MELTMGNFFSGSGTWELAAKMCGIKVLFESEIEPFPVALEAKRFPEAIQLGDVSKVDGAKIPAVDILTNSSPCFAEDSLVRTSDGLKKICDVKVGDQVLTHGQVFREVLDSGCTGHKKVMRLRAMGIDEIIATPNHPFYVRKRTEYASEVKKSSQGVLFLFGYTYRYSKPEWKQLSELSKDYLIGLPVYDGPTSKCDMPDSMLWLVGLYISGGKLINDQKTVKLPLTPYVKERAPHGHKEEDLWVLEDTEIWQICSGCGDTDKHFPAWAYTINKHKQKCIIDGYAAGMRFQNTQKPVFEVGSRELALDLMYFLTVIHDHPFMLNNRGYGHYYVTPHEDAPGGAFYENGYVWLPVRSVKEFGEADVYNLTVDGDNSYTVQNIAVHNCQDLSIAGKRAGLDGARSGLFGEVIRITKEMRAHAAAETDDNLRLAGLKPRFWCWENVPGALSSNSGRDFQTVLREVSGIVSPETDIPLPKGGRWSNWGIVDGDNWQLAWACSDAQYMGVPQRRKRVFLVGDFGGRCAAEILFKPESVSWDFKEIVRAWETTSLSLGERISQAGRIVMGRV